MKTTKKEIHHKKHRGQYQLKPLSISYEYIEIINQNHLDQVFDLIFHEIINNKQVNQ